MFTNAQFTKPSIGDIVRGPKKTVLDLCPVHRFEEALRYIAPLVPAGLAEAGGVQTLAKQYAVTYKRKRCVDVGEDRFHWPESVRKQHGLLINAGEGSSGTHFLKCLMERLEIPTAHHVLSEWHECETKGNCTHAFDRYGFISNEPVPEHYQELLNTHHGSTLGGVMLSLREPREWFHVRYYSHLQAGSKKWRFAAPCGPGQTLKTLLSLNNYTVMVAQLKLTYDAYATCLALSSSPSAFFAFNLFQPESAAAFTTGLYKFLKPLLVVRGALTPSRLSGAVRSCNATLTPSSSATQRSRGNAKAPGKTKGTRKTKGTKRPQARLRA